MNWDAIGAIGEVLGALAVIITLGYLSVQVRQNTAQLKREETVTIQQGINEVLSQMREPVAVRSYAIMAEKGRAAEPEDRSRSIMFLVQYLNQFQIVYDLYHLGSLDEERYKFWESIAISFVACKGLREWWDDEGGKSAFTAEIQSLFDSKLNQSKNAPVGVNEIFDIFNANSWRT